MQNDEKQIGYAYHTMHIRQLLHFSSIFRGILRDIRQYTEKCIFISITIAFVYIHTIFDESSKQHNPCFQNSFHSVCNISTVTRRIILCQARQNSPKRILDIRSVRMKMHTELRLSRMHHAREVHRKRCGTEG